MNSKWLSDLQGQEKIDMRAGLVASRPVLKRLTKLLEDKMSSVESSRLNRDKYDKSSWPYFQADCNGYQRAISEIIKLIEVE